MSSFLDFVHRHWYFAIPMFVMSAIAITMVIWRIMLNLNANTNLNEFLPLFQERLKTGGIEGALKFCNDERTDLIPNKLFKAGLENGRLGTAAMRRAMANAIELEILPDLNFLLAPILAIAKIATMVGLFGTVISMIGTFNKIQGSNSGNVTNAAGDIGLALYATALGLITAIPLVFAHVLFKDWISKFEVKMKSSAQKLLLLVQSAKPAPAAAGARSTGDSAVTRRQQV
jgi:biopolymer transport protein ExbB